MYHILRHRIALILLLVSVTFSCEPLKLEPEITNEHQTVSEKQLELLNGIYYLISEAHNEDYFYMLSRSDDVSVFSYLSDRCKLGSCNLETVIENFYQSMYRAIISANKLIDELDPETDGHLYGEVLFLKGYCYFKLSRLFYNPPYIDNYEVQYRVIYMDKPALYEKVENILLEAEQYLPVSAMNARVPGESPDKGTVSAFLAELYLSWAGYPVFDNDRYAMAAERAEQVISNHEDYGCSFAEDYADLWNASVENKEIIFGTYFNKNHGIINHIIQGKVTSVLNDSIYTFQSVFVPGIDFFFSFPENYRKQVSLRTGNYVKKRISQPGEGYIYQLQAVDSTTTYWDFANTVFYKKWLGGSPIDSSAVNQVPFKSDAPLSILRYTQTLLTWAESMARLNEADENVREVINMIRRRANHADIYTDSKWDVPPGLSNDELINLIIRERAWELCMEPEGRWFDVVRLELLDELDKNRNPIDQKITFNGQLSTDPYFLNNPEKDKWLIEEIQGQQ